MLRVTAIPGDSSYFVPPCIPSKLWGYFLTPQNSSSASAHQCILREHFHRERPEQITTRL